MIEQLVLAIYLIVVNWLSYAKQIPTKPFLGIPFLLPGWIPLVILLAFWLYQPKLHWKVSRNTIVALLIIIVAVFGLRLTPGVKFTEIVNLAKTTSVMPKFTPTLTANAGAEIAVAYLGSISGDELLAYRGTLALVILLLLIMVTKLKDMPIRPDLRHWALALIIFALISTRIIQFGDILNLLIFLLLWVTLFQTWHNNSDYILGGIVWTAMLMVNPIAAICLVTPFALIRYPRQYALGWFIAILINPLMIGRLL